MKSVLRALAISLAVHCLVGAAIVLAISAAKPVELPRLDLSAVELSLSEEEEETAPPAPAAEPAPPPSEAEPPPDSRPPSRVPEPKPEPPPPEPDPPPPEPEPYPDSRPPGPVPEPKPPPPEPAPPPPEPEPPPDSRPPSRVPEPKLEPPPPEPAPLPSEAKPHPDSRPPSRVPEPEPEPQNPAPPSPPAPAVAPKQARVEAPPRLLKTIRPDYPKGPRQRGEEGDVGLEFSITPRGTVDSVTVYSSSGYAELDAAAVRAAKKARFSPAMEGRRAVSATARLVVSFRLKDR